MLFSKNNDEWVTLSQYSYHNNIIVIKIDELWIDKVLNLQIKENIKWKFSISSQIKLTFYIEIFP